MSSKEVKCLAFSGMTVAINLIGMASAFFFLYSIAVSSEPSWRFGITWFLVFLFNLIANPLCKQLHANHTHL